MVQQPAEDLRREPERETRDNSERSVGKAKAKKVRSDHPDPAGFDIAGCLAETLCPDLVELDSDNVGVATGESKRDRARARTYLDYKLAGGDAGGLDELLSDLRAKKVLPETASSLVSNCPPSRGHGPSP